MLWIKIIHAHDAFHQNRYKIDILIFFDIVEVLNNIFDKKLPSLNFVNVSLMLNGN